MQGISPNDISSALCKAVEDCDGLPNPQSKNPMTLRCDLRRACSPDVSSAPTADRRRLFAVRSNRVSNHKIGKSVVVNVLTPFWLDKVRHACAAALLREAFARWYAKPPAMVT